MKTETRGRKPIKSFKIKVGQLKKIAISDGQRFRYAANKNGWKVSMRTINGKLMVFREL